MGRLREQGYNGGATVSTDNGDMGIGWRDVADPRKESSSSDDVEGGYAKYVSGVEDIRLFEGSGDDGDGGVDGVGNDEDIGFWGDFGDDFDQAFDDAGVDVEEVIAGHSWLACFSISISPCRSSLYVRGIPAGMTTMSASLKASLAPSSLGR